MKKISVSAILLLLFTLSACERDKDDINIDPLILGKWMLDRTVEEDYQPIDVLLESDETMGEPGDSLVFKGNNTIMVYSDVSGPEEESFEMINDSTVRIEFETYKIRKLTDTEFYLHEEEIDNALNEKWIYKIYLKR